MPYKTGEIDLPLHSGKAPFGLINRMKKLGAGIFEALLFEFGEDEILKRISDPLWFQSLGCLLGFDWHSSGLTTTLTYALKIGFQERNLPLFIAGGKGKYGVNTPFEIKEIAQRNSFEPHKLIHSSKMCAKVDNSCVQDGFNIYHHTIFFSKNGKWAVVEQGMNTKKTLARRYHWLGERVKEWTKEPHSGIITSRRNFTLNLVDKNIDKTRKLIAEIAKEKPEKIRKQIEKVKNIKLPERHHILLQDINPLKIEKVFLSIYNIKNFSNFEELVAIKGIGPKSLRALALLAEILYGADLSYEDPARFSFAHGGKDGIPYPVNRRTYDKTIEVMEKAIKSAKLGRKELLITLKKLASLI